MVVRLERRRHVHQVHLERLDHHEVGAFVAAVYGRTLGTGVVDALRNRTGGNPFFLEEILAAAGDADPEALATNRCHGRSPNWSAGSSTACPVEQRRAHRGGRGARTTGAIRRAGGPRRPLRGGVDRRSARPRRSWPPRRGGRRRVQLPPRARPRRRRGPAARASNDADSTSRPSMLLRQSMGTDLADLARHAAGAGQLRRDGRAGPRRRRPLPRHRRDPPSAAHRRRRPRRGSRRPRTARRQRHAPPG